jgi:carboxymethylenebutenolidase
MCYDSNAQPPNPPGTPGRTRGEDRVLTAADGNQFAAFVASPERSAATGVVIYPDVRGLHQFYKDLALRFAEQGVASVAFDYFGRTAGLTARDDSFEYMPHVMQLKPGTVLHDTRAAIAAIQPDGTSAIATCIVGFCLGGSLALLAGTEALNIAGLVSFYAGLARDMGAGTVLSRAPGIKYPTLALFGGADQHIPADQVAQLDVELDKAGIWHEVVSYPGAPHSFFDRRSAEFAEQSADAWNRILAFLGDRVTPTS